MMMALGSTIRSFIALKCSRKILGYYLIFYVLMIVIAMPFLAEGIKDYFGVVGTLAFCVSVWMKENFILHRMFAFAHQTCWIIAFIFLGSYGGLAFTVFIFVSNVIGTGRYLWTQKILSKRS